MREYLIRPVDDEWFNIKNADYPTVLRPATTPSRQIQGWGSHRIEVEGAEVSFSDEEVGFQVVFETGSLEATRARAIVDEICQSIESHTKQKARVVEL